MYRVMLDTNILLDAIVRDRPQHAEAWKVLEWCNGSGDLGMACTLSFKDLYYVLQRDLPEESARAAVALLMEYLVVVPVDAEAAYDAIVSNEPDFEDGLVRRCAELNDVDFILTRDRKAFANSKVRSVTAGEFLRIVEAENRALFAGM